jgi:beta-1,4-mannosyltransferase
MNSEGLKKLIAVLANKATGTDTVFYTPVAYTNPYQKLLYSSGPRSFLPAPHFARMEDAARLKLFSALHIHWEELLLRQQSGQGPTEAAETIVGTIRRLKDMGIGLIWTCHNSLPHESDSPEELMAFKHLRQFFCTEADLIHVHSSFAGDDLVESYGAERTKIAVVPHPSYLDQYPLSQARQDIGSKRRFLSFGRMRRYKGIPEIADAFKNLSSPERVEFLALMGPGSPDTVEGLDFGVPTKFDLQKIPGEEVPGVFAGADFMVLAFTRALTSGSALLAITFGVPVIVPNHPGIVENLPAELGELIYDAEKEDGLRNALEYACRMDAREYARLSAKCLEFARHLSPSRVSAMLVDEAVKRKIVRKIA